MIYIPPGEFVMGAEHPAHGRVQANNTEEPVHRVTIAYGFYISRYEITQAQWQAVTGNNPSYFKGQSLPVESVSFANAIQFTNTLNQTPAAAQRAVDCLIQPVAGILDLTDEIRVC